MTLLSLFGLELVDEDLRDDAIRKLHTAQKYGFDRIIWNIHGWNTNNYPNYDRSILEKLLGDKKEFKSRKELPQDYLTRIIFTGRSVELEGNLYVIKESIGLEFRLSPEVTRTTEDRVTFYDEFYDSALGFGILTDLSNVEGQVPIRYHNFRLDYIDWKFTNYLFLEKGKPTARPLEINFK